MRLDPRIPITWANCAVVPGVPRRVGGASSPRKMGTTTEENLIKNNGKNKYIHIYMWTRKNMWGGVVVSR